MADTSDLGSGGISVQVQVLLPAPTARLTPLRIKNGEIIIKNKDKEISPVGVFCIILYSLFFIFLHKSRQRI